MILAATRHEFVLALLAADISAGARRAGMMISEKFCDWRTGLARRPVTSRGVACELCVSQQSAKRYAAELRAAELLDVFERGPRGEPRYALTTPSRPLRWIDDETLDCDVADLEDAPPVEVPVEPEPRIDATWWNRAKELAAGVVRGVREAWGDGDEARDDGRYGAGRDSAGRGCEVGAANGAGARDSGAPSGHDPHAPGPCGEFRDVARHDGRALQFALGAGAPGRVGAPAAREPGDRAGASAGAGGLDAGGGSRTGRDGLPGPLIVPFTGGFGPPPTLLPRPSFSDDGYRAPPPGTRISGESAPRERGGPPTRVDGLGWLDPGPDPAARRDTLGSDRGTHADLVGEPRGPCAAKRESYRDVDQRTRGDSRASTPAAPWVDPDPWIDDYQVDDRADPVAAGELVLDADPVPDAWHQGRTYSEAEWRALQAVPAYQRAPEGPRGPGDEAPHRRVELAYRAAFFDARGVHPTMRPVDHVAIREIIRDVGADGAVKLIRGYYATWKGKRFGSIRDVARLAFAEACERRARTT